MIDYDYKSFNELKKGFSKDNYCVMKNAFSKDLISYLYHLSYFTYKNDPSIETNNDDIVKNKKNNLTLNGYSTILGESLLVTLTQLYRDITDKPLEPSYSFFRIYQNGDILENHRDRPSCQYSATIQLKSEDNYQWPFNINNGKLNTVLTSPGDIIFYKGEEVWHERSTPLPINTSAHLFLHWVDGSDPKYKPYIFDGRAELGLSHRNN